MKELTTFVLLAVTCFVDGIPFVTRRSSLPGSGFYSLYRGGGKSLIFDTTDDYERAEKAILMSVEKIEAIVEKAVANEVDILFHKDHPQKEKVTSNAKKAVAEGVKKVKTTIQGHSEKGLYPYETKSQPKKSAAAHRDHRVLNAIEAAERAVLRAISTEVDTLFHEMVHEDKSSEIHNHLIVPKQAKTTVQDGIMKASTVLDNVHDHRRDWLLNVSTTMIEDYTLPGYFLE